MEEAAVFKPDTGYEHWIEGWLIVWLMVLLTVGYLTLRSRARPTVGLLLAYILVLCAMYCPGAIIQLFPWYERPEQWLAYVAVRESAVAAIAFVAGALIYASLRSRLKSRIVAPIANSGRHRLRRLWKSGAAALGRRFHCEVRRTHNSFGELPFKYLMLGASLFIVQGFIQATPSLQALMSMLGFTLLIGLCLECWTAWIERNTWSLLGWLLVACSLPFGTMLLNGFMAYGLAMLLLVLTFTVSFLRPRWLVLASSVLVGYGMLSLYINYMNQRDLIRQEVWGAAPLTDRVSAIGQIFTQFESFDPRNPDHLEQIENRMDQSRLFGLAYINLRRTGAYANGETIADAVLALVPRALWRDKPIHAGSGDVVSRFTRMRFSEGTSVGMGQLFELYVNFGSAGVMVGFFIFGILMAMVDGTAGSCLWSGNWKKFAVLYVIGVGMMQPGGSLAEISASVAAGAIATMMVNWLLCTPRGSAGSVSILVLTPKARHSIRPKPAPTRQPVAPEVSPSPEVI